MELQILTSIERHHGYFRSFIKLLAEKYQPLRILCISKKISYQSATGCFRQETSSIVIDYSLLLITESNTRIDHEVQDYVNHMYEDGTITVLCHGRESADEAISRNNRFFIHAYSYGDLLYSHDGIPIFSPTSKYDSSYGGAKALKHFNHHFTLGQGFLDGAKTCLKNGQYNVCVFLLHQTMEQTCIGMIRVFLAYRSEVHNLNRLLRLCNCFSDIPYNWFFTGRGYDHHLFEILAKSYSQARYGRTFLVDETDAQFLFDRVSGFSLLANEMCRKKIDEFNSEGTSAVESEVTNG